MKRDLVTPIQDLFDAAARHHTIRLDCPPRWQRVGIFDGHAIWWLFERKEWAMAPWRINSTASRRAY